MTIRPGQPASRKSPTAASTKLSAKGMDVVMMNDFEQRHLTNKSRSHSPYGHIGSPTTPLNFDQLFLQSQLSLNTELSQHEQGMLQAQLLNSMRSTGMAHKPKQQSQQSLAILDQLRQAYNRGEQEQVYNRGAEQDQAEWNARLFTAAAAHQQHQQGQPQLHKEEPPTEPSSIALLQQKFAQLDRHRAEMQKSASQPQQVQMYPPHWPMSVQQHGTPMPQPPVSSATYSESRHFAQPNVGLYPQQHQQVLPPIVPEAPEQFYSAKLEMPWRPTQDTRVNSTGSGWALGNATSASLEMGNNSPRMYLSQQQSQQFQHQQPQPFPAQQPKVVNFQQNMQHRVPEFAVPQLQSFSSFQLNGPPAPDMGLLSSAVVSSRCDKTGGHSVEIKSVSDYSNDDSEMSLDNFSGRLPSQISQSQASSAPSSSQISLNNFHTLPQSSKSAFSTFTRPISNLNPAAEFGFVTRSLLFNDTYRHIVEESDVMNDDVDTELRL